MNLEELKKTYTAYSNLLQERTLTEWEKELLMAPHSDNSPNLADMRIKALLTVYEWQTRKRLAESNDKHSRAMIGLTIALVIVWIVQAISTFR